jgi:putative transposase
MAKKWTNENLPGALHFVTGNVLGRKPIFRQDENYFAFLEELQNLRHDYECKLIAFVLMPDHFHLTLNPRDGDIQKHTGILKSLSAKRLVELAPKDFFRTGDVNQVWQESLKAMPLWSGWMIKQKINYVHSNPVRAGLVVTTDEYRWSSFHSFYGEPDDKLLETDKDWWWPEDVEKLNAAMMRKKEELDRSFLIERDENIEKIKTRGQARLSDCD